MQSKDLENYIEFLLSVALQRCGNIYDAEDLTQETLLAALSYMARGKDIQDVKAWLLVVMGRKFNDMLRKRYKQPIVSIGDDFDIVDENTTIQVINPHFKWGFNFYSSAALCWFRPLGGFHRYHSCWLPPFRRPLILRVYHFLPGFEYIPESFPRSHCRLL